jgi:hypothetical protein
LTNRVNAKKSTGPRTAAGKTKVAQNGRKHGLNSSILKDPAWAGRALEVARTLTSDRQVTDAIFAYAKKFAELERVRMLKDQERDKLVMLLSGAVLFDSEQVSEILKGLNTLSGYERRLASRLRKDRLEVETGVSTEPHREFGCGRNLAAQSQSSLSGKLADQSQSDRHPGSTCLAQVPPIVEKVNAQAQE